MKGVKGKKRKVRSREEGAGGKETDTQTYQDNKVGER